MRRASTASDGVADGRMANQDDWVRQARELSIASPLSVTAGFPHTMDGTGSAAVAQSRVDEHMVSPSLKHTRASSSQTMLKTSLGHRLLTTRSPTRFVYTYIQGAHGRGPRGVIYL